MTEVLTTTEATPQDAGRPRTSLVGRVTARVDGSPPWLRWLVVAFVMTILSTVLVGRYAYGHDPMSRSDEYVYIDAVWKAQHGEITRQGAEIDEPALDLIACRGIELYGPMGEKCGGPYDRSTFPYRGGITSADIHSPVYYFVTAGLTTVIQAVSPVDDLLIAARMTGALWLGLGLVALIWLCRELGAGRSASGAVALLVLSVPIVRWTNTYVTPDAMNLLWGSLISIAALKYLRGRWSPWILIALSAAAAAVKAQNSIASAFVAVLLVLCPLTAAEGRSWARVRSNALVAAGAIGAALAVQTTYNMLRKAWALAPAPPSDTSAPFNVEQAFAQAKVFVTGTVMGPDASWLPALSVTRPGVFSVLASWYFAAALIAGALFVVHLRPLQMRFAQAAALSFVAAGPVFYTLIYVMTGRAFPLPERYGAVLLPAMAAVAAVLSQRRWVQVLVTALAIGGYVSAMISLHMV